MAWALEWGNAEHSAGIVPFFPQDIAERVFWTGNVALLIGREFPCCFFGDSSAVALCFLGLFEGLLSSCSVFFADLHIPPGKAASPASKWTESG